jgi:hypothetical protein
VARQGSPHHVEETLKAGVIRTQHFIVGMSSYSGCFAHSEARGDCKEKKGIQNADVLSLYLTVDY